MSVPSRSNRKSATPEATFGRPKRYARIRDRSRAARRRRFPRVAGAPAGHPHARRARRGRAPSPGRLPLPGRRSQILGGERMVKDPAAIYAYGMAVAAAVSGPFSLVPAGTRFLVVGAGGTAAGLAVGWLLGGVRRHIHDP